MNTAERSYNNLYMFMTFGIRAGQKLVYILSVVGIIQGLKIIVGMITQLRFDVSFSVFQL